MVSQWVCVCFTWVIAMIWQKTYVAPPIFPIFCSPITLFMSVMTDFDPLVLFLGLNVNEILVVAFRRTKSNYKYVVINAATDRVATVWWWSSRHGNAICCSILVHQFGPDWYHKILDESCWLWCHYVVHICGSERNILITTRLTMLFSTNIQDKS